MASIMYLECDSCKETFKISGGFPYFTNSKRERKFPMVPVAIELVDKIEGYRYTQFCKKCCEFTEFFVNKERNSPEVCSECNQNESLKEGDICPACKNGKVYMDFSRIVSF